MLLKQGQPTDIEAAGRATADLDAEHNRCRRARRNRHEQRRSAGRGRNQRGPAGWEAAIGTAELTAREEELGAEGAAGAAACSGRRSSERRAGAIGAWLQPEGQGQNALGRRAEGGGSGLASRSAHAGSRSRRLAGTRSMQSEEQAETTAPVGGAAK